jgi:glycosyltransferase involved in cell wall biosynthesis
MAIAWRMAAALRAQRPTDVIIQYTAQMWDAWRFGSPAVPWVAGVARRMGARVTFLAHELFLTWHTRPDLMAAATLTRLQFAALARIAHHTFVTTESRIAYAAPWCRMLGLPLPGVIKIGPNALPIAGARDLSPRAAPRIGVFSTASKRFDVVLEAFSKVAAVWPDAELVLIGDLGPPDAPQVRAVRDAVSGHPGQARIRLTGKLPLAEVAREVAALDVYLFPMETGANTRSGTLPVALGSGLPVVAISGQETDPGLFRDGDNILLAPALDGAAFGAAALRALGDPALSARVGAGARALYVEHLSWARITDDFLARIS